MKKILVLISLLLALATGYLWGVNSNQKSEFDRLNKKLVSISETSLLNDALTVSLLEHIFDNYQENPAIGEEIIKRRILMMYANYKYRSSHIEDSLSNDDRVISIDDKVKSFIKKHPLKECISEMAEDRFECSLSALKESHIKGEM